jgi:hypothetical protein
MWRLFAPLIVIAGIIAGSTLIDKRFGGKLLASFINAEGAVGLWTANGWSFPFASLLGIACSTCDLFMWCWMFGDLHAVLERAENFLGEHAARKSFGSVSRKIRIWTFLARILFLFTIKPSSCRAIKLQQHVPIFAIALPAIGVLGFFPGCVWTAIFLIFSLEIEIVPAFLALAVGNACKVILFGGIGSGLTTHFLRTTRFSHLEAAGLAFAVIVLLQRALEKWMRKKILQPAPLLS